MFLHPFGLLGLLGVPAVVLLHLFRRRFRPRVVGALFLWQRRDETTLAGRTAERIHRSRSFWCEVLAALLLGLAAAGPRACGSGEALHLVAVLDGSLSMGARTGDGTVRERAVRELRARLSRLPRRARVTVLESGPRPRVLAGPAADLRDAEASLAAYEPTQGHHALGATLGLASELAGGGGLLLLTDGPPEAGLPGTFELVALGAPAPNRAIVRAARVVGAPGESGTLLLTLRQFGGTAGPVRGVVLAVDDGGELASTPAAAFEAELRPGARTLVRVPVPPGLGPAVVELEPDALAADDRAFLAPPPERTLRVASRLAPGYAASLGLAEPGAAPGDVRRWTGWMDGLVVDAGDPQLVVREAGDPPPTRGAWELVVHAPSGARETTLGPFLPEKRHPLLEGVVLAGTPWTYAPGAALPGRALLSAGDVPLIAEERAGATRRVHLNLDPARAAVARSADWPILLANLVELRRDALPGPPRTNLLAGEAYLHRAPGPGPFVVSGPDGERAVPGGDPLEVHGLVTPGLYRMRAGERELAVFAVNASDPRESDLSDRASERRAATLGEAVVRAGIGWLQVALAAVALGLLLLDWLFLAGRWGGTR